MGRLYFITVLILLRLRARFGEDVSSARCDRVAFSASHLCGLFLPQRDPEKR
jgi:hypothetical protein